MSLISVILLSACATTPDSVRRDGILCIKDEAARQWEPNCLDPVTAKAEEVYRRVAIYNDFYEEDKHMNCKRRKRTGSNFSRWYCQRNLSPAQDAVNAEEFEDAIRQGSF